METSNMTDDVTIPPLPNFTHFLFKDDDTMVYHQVEKFIYGRLVFALCIFGILGNVLNLLILSQKSLTSNMGRLERSAHIGLMALALSDMLFCVSALPQCVNPTLYRPDPPSVDFWLVYDVYHEAVINTFLLASAWLTVAMAASRYVAVCLPLRARSYLGLTTTRATVAGVFVGSLLFNIPRFFMHRIAHEDCQEGYRVYYKDSSSAPMSMKQNSIARTVYNWLYFVLGIVLPLIVLIYCNAFLVRTLQKATSERKRLSNSQTSNKSGNKSSNLVTLTLCIIVVLYVVLVGPCEILTFWKDYVTNNFNFKAQLKYSMAVAICNCLQTVNFSMNFVLYCIVNTHFRKIFMDLVTCKAFYRRYSPVRGAELMRNKDTSSTCYTNVNDSTTMVNSTDV